METKRVTVQLKCPNPLFEMWLEEMYVSAAINDSKTKHKLQTALKSLRKYPLVLNSGSECAILKGFGKTICQILNNKLNKYKQNQNHLPVDSVLSPLKEIKRKLPQDPSSSQVAPSLKKVKCGYVPGYRTGAYAILITLYENLKRDINWMTKSEIQTKAQEFCDESMTKPKPGGSFYTAWSNMKSLVSKGFVTKEKKKVILFSLTEEGCSLSQKLLTESSKLSNVENNCVLISPDDVLETIDNVNEVGGKCHNQSPNKCSGMITGNIFTFTPKSFDVLLLVDKQEISGAAKKDDATILELNKYKMIQYEMRHLKVGDFTWVARHRETQSELVLPYIVERKRIDDLSGSIKDGRFHEQKFRLKKCGIPNLIYLVESYGNNKRTSLPLSTLMQAVTNTRVQDGFMTHFTPSLAGSIKFLAMMTKNLSNIYMDKTLTSSGNENEDSQVSINKISLMEFNYFNAMASKNKVLTVKDVLIKQLLQMKGISVEKAVAIATLYKTPKNLMDTYKNCCDVSKAELLLADIKYGNLKTKVGPSISKILYRYFTDEVLH